MSGWVSAGFVHRRRATTVFAAAVAVMAAGLAFGPREMARATLVGGGVSVNDPAINEGNAGGAQLTFTVTASGVYVAPPTTVYYTTKDGTAKAGEDYVAKSGTLTISGTGSQSVVVQLNGDTLVEPNETVLLELHENNASGALIDTGTGTITNDDFAVSVANRTVTEGDSGTANAPVVISLQGGTRQAATTVQYSTVDATAVAPGDYTPSSAVTATIPAGSTSVTVNIPVKGDALYEDDETFRVVLSNPSVGVSIDDGDASVTIVNNDPLPDPSQQPTITIADKTIAEGDAGTATANLDLTLSGPVPYTVTVKATTVDGSAVAATDFAAFSGATATFAPGQTSAALPVTINGDTKDEFNETFTVKLSNASPGAQIVDDTSVVTITDDDPTPTLSVADASGNEGAKVTFTLKLSETSGRDTVVAVGTFDDTATAPDDYTALPGATTRFTILAGQTTKTFDVDTITDALDEADETFDIVARQATNPDATTFGEPATATGTIKDATTSPQLSVADLTKAEGNSGVTPFDFTVTLAPSSSQTVKVNYTVGSDSSFTAASSGTDFVPATGQLTFAPGETTKTITVAVNGDANAEDNETFKVTLSAPQNATLGDGVAVGTITNDDGTFIRPGAITTGAGPGGDSHVRLFSLNGEGAGPGFYATVNGPGVRVARGDLDGDGHDEVIASSGPGGPSVVRVFTPNGSGVVAEVDAYPGFKGGVSIAAGDLDGDGKDEIITGAGPGGGAHVRSFALTGDPGNRSLVGTQGFLGAGSGPSYTGGVNVAAGDTDGDGKAEIITAVVSQAPPVVGVWKFNPATNNATLQSFFLAFDQGFRGGVNVAAGDFDGDGKVEIVAGAGPGGAPHVRLLTPSGGGLPGSAYAYGADFPGGVQVAVGDIDGDGDNELITGVGAGGGPHVRGFDLDDAGQLRGLPTTSFYAYGADFPGGVNVAVGRP